MEKLLELVLRKPSLLSRFRFPFSFRRRRNVKQKEPQLQIRIFSFFHDVPPGLGRAKIISKLILLWEPLRIDIEMLFIEKQGTLITRLHLPLSCSKIQSCIAIDAKYEKVVFGSDK
ncbi:hypothetical protein YC2023_019242 [Brassica napus]